MLANYVSGVFGDIPGHTSGLWESSNGRRTILSDQFFFREKKPICETGGTSSFKDLKGNLKFEHLKNVEHE